MLLCGSFLHFSIFCVKSQESAFLGFQSEKGSFAAIPHHSGRMLNLKIRLLRTL
jgi:hypothetical protein